MADVQAASSPAEVDVFQGQEPTLAEYQQYRESGEVPARFKPAEPADPAPAAAQEQTEESEAEEAESASESETEEEAQEQPAKGAEKRIRQLLAKTKELERKLAERNQTHSDPSPAANQPPQNYQDYRKGFKPSEWIAKYAEQNPTASYEDANAAMADHLFDVRKHFETIEQRVNAEKQALDAKVSEAKERYTDFDEIKADFLSKTVGDKGTPLIPLPVLGIINDSDVLPDLLYTLAENDVEFDEFIAMAKANPNKAIRYVARVEALIAEELAKPKETPVRGEDGKFTAPVTKKTQAPKPPSPVGGGSARTFDVNDESLSPDEWARQRREQLARKKA